MNLFHLVYVSSAKPGFGRAQMRVLLERSRLKNEAMGITGLLLHHEGKLLQVLEGRERAVRALFERVQADNRHAGVTVLREEELPARQYPQWAMAFRDLGMSDLPALGGLPSDLSEAQQVLLHLHLGGPKPRLPRLLAA
jgi:hypothetical protein